MPLTNAQGLSRADAVMIEIYEQKVATLPELETPILDKVRGMAKTVKINQKGRVKAHTYDVRMQVKGGAPDMNYPVASDWRRGRWRVTPVTQAVTYAIDAATYEDYTKGDPSVFVSLTDEMANLGKGFSYFEEVWLGGDGSGTLGTLSAGQSIGDTTITMQATPDGTHGKAFGVAFLRRGVTYEIRSSAGAFRQYVTIADTAAAINYSTNVVTLSAALTAALSAGDKIYFKDSYGYAKRGFAYLFQGGKTGWWQGFNCNGLMETNTPSYAAGGRAPSSATIEAMLQKHAFRSGKGINATFKIVTSPSLISIYKQPAWGMRRLGAGDTQYQGGVKTAQFEDSIFIPAPKFDADAMYGVDFSDLYYLEQTKKGPLVVDGVMWHQSIGDGYGAGTRYMQLGCVDQFAIDQPHLHMVGRNFDTTGSVTIGNYYN